MNPTETFPHRKDTPYGTSPDCRCGADDAGAVGIGATWGEDCPAALRDALAKVEQERDAALARIATLEADNIGLREQMEEAFRLRDEALARVDELERETPLSAVEMLARARDAVALSGNGFLSIFSADESWFAAVTQVRDRRHAAALLRWRGGGAR